MRLSVPNLVQYQGSKRKLAPAILSYMPAIDGMLIEPFCGMASITLAAAQNNRASFYWLNDVNQDVVNVLNAAINNPDSLASDYERIWLEQFDYADGHVQHYYAMRDECNAGNDNPAVFLYLMARCVKGAVRYGPNGLNQSPDKRRHGTKPSLMRSNIGTVSALLKGRSRVSSLDYKDVLAECGVGDLVYMDPPYQGTSGTRDSRYVSGVAVDELESELFSLDSRGIRYVLSYDGVCGVKSYGRELSSDLKCHKYLLDAGRSTQSTLLGRDDRTLEALYVSDDIVPMCPNSELPLMD